MKSYIARKKFTDFYDDCSDDSSEEDADVCDKEEDDDDESPPAKNTNWLAQNLAGMFEKKVNLKDKVDEQDNLKEDSDDEFWEGVEKVHKKSGWKAGMTKNNLKVFEDLR